MVDQPAELPQSTCTSVGTYKTTIMYIEHYKERKAEEEEMMKIKEIKRHKLYTSNI